VQLGDVREQGKIVRRAVAPERPSAGWAVQLLGPQDADRKLQH
jgi:hypothetical protein